MAVCISPPPPPPYGSGATLLRDGVPHGAWFVAYEWSKRHLAELTAAGGERRSDAAVGVALVTTLLCCTRNTFS
jgi:hypothetical protein